MQSLEEMNCTLIYRVNSGEGDFGYINA